MVFALIAMVAAAPTALNLPKEDIQEVLASWEAAQLYCERGSKKACADQKTYAAKMRAQYGLCPDRTGERGALTVCKTGKKVEVSFD